MTKNIIIVLFHFLIGAINLYASISIIDKDLTYQVESTTSQRVKRVNTHQVSPFMVQTVEHNIPSEIQANVKLTRLEAKPTPSTSKFEFKSSSLKETINKPGAFMITPYTAVSAKEEDGKIWDYYHVSLDCKFNPNEIIDAFKTNHDRRLYVSKYIIEAYPIMMTFHQGTGYNIGTYFPLDSIDNAPFFLEDTKPAEDQGSTEETYGTDLGLQVNAQYAPGAGIGGNFTAHHSKTRSYKDIQYIRKNSNAGAHAKWELNVFGIQKNEKKSSAVSSGSNTPYVQWLWRVDRNWAQPDPNNANRYSVYESKVKWDNLVANQPITHSVTPPLMLAFNVKLSVEFETRNLSHHHKYPFDNIIDHIYCVKQPAQPNQSSSPQSINVSNTNSATNGIQNNTNVMPMTQQQIVNALLQTLGITQFSNSQNSN